MSLKYEPVSVEVESCTDLAQLSTFSRVIRRGAQAMYKLRCRVHSRCRLLIVPLFSGSRKFESSILSHLSRLTCDCNKEEINDDDDSLQGLGAPRKPMGMSDMGGVRLPTSAVKQSRHG